MIEKFKEELEKYSQLSTESIQAFVKILKPQSLNKGDYFLRQGQVPKSYAYIKSGLFSYFHTYENGDIVIKKFFSENSFIASTAALIGKKPSLFAIQALEETKILEYQNTDFRQLMKKHPEIAFFYINYLEQNWVVAKEPLEINLKYKTAKVRYEEFQSEYETIESRLKQHQIASYLGITPTQLSRIKKAIKK
ncbi:Crp/Fnr family transcriptional regulator [Wenyingzhuangia marina]|uniref:Cyclic nucleotide-binding protein n=1 Tax=Wenyingzhuangia marina TaxID=1195760 RepID=A0A1M5UDE4_9FLAO|nr:Crp/Fnr family transcriptional regulator [Wenyingzhuangia marina]GGF68304.1 cAMP-binding protein [Wenyingzhuangia marina]SHH61072.1 cyclic nucleotide-binding protein [Wenyingzhuangia marina]